MQVSPCVAGVDFALLLFVEPFEQHLVHLEDAIFVVHVDDAAALVADYVYMHIPGVRVLGGVQPLQGVLGLAGVDRHVRVVLMSVRVHFVLFLEVGVDLQLFRVKFPIQLIDRVRPFHGVVSLVRYVEEYFVFGDVLSCVDVVVALDDGLKLPLRVLNPVFLHISHFLRD